MAYFLIRTAKQSGEATLYVRIQKKKPEVDWLFTTGIKVNITDWRKYYESGNAKLWDNYTKEGSIGAEIKKKMNLVSETIDLLFDDGSIRSSEDKPILVKALSELANHDAIIKRKEINQREREERERKMHEIVPCCENYIKGIKDGVITDKRCREGKYTEGTIAGWITFFNHLKDYTKAGTTFEDITPEWVQRFRLYLEKKGLMPTTINKLWGTAQHLCRYSASQGWNRNAISLSAWVTPTVKKGQKQTEIYLTEEELDALYKMPLEGTKAKVRDLFFIGVFSAQRVSDYSEFKPYNITKTDKGTPIFKLTQKKTGSNVEVPILDARCYEILERYDYQSPEVPLQYVNLLLKDIFKELAKSVPSLMQEYPTAMTRREKDAESTYLRLCEKAMNNEPMTKNELVEYKRRKQYAFEHDGEPVFKRDGRGNILKYKWELITSHTARRSAITNLHKLGLRERDLIVFSGHTNLKNLEKYIRTGLSEEADRIAEKMNSTAKTIDLKKEA